MRDRFRWRANGQAVVDFKNALMQTDDSSNGGGVSRSTPIASFWSDNPTSHDGPYSITN